MSLEKILGGVLGGVAVPVTLMAASVTSVFVPEVKESLNGFQYSFALGVSGLIYWGTLTSLFGAITVGCGAFAIKELVVDPVKYFYSKINQG